MGHCTNWWRRCESKTSDFAPIQGMLARRVLSSAGHAESRELVLLPEDTGHLGGSELDSNDRLREPPRHFLVR
jgi:hypothetical protein